VEVDLVRRPTKVMAIETLNQAVPRVMEGIYQSRHNQFVAGVNRLLGGKPRFQLLRRAHPDNAISPHSDRSILQYPIFVINCDDQAIHDEKVHWFKAHNSSIKS
jgi:hypothetical protein